MFGLLGAQRVILFSDNFNRADEANPTGWSEDGGGPFIAWRILSNTLDREEIAGEDVIDPIYVTSLSGEADAYAECVPKTDYVGPMLRFGSSGGYKGYVAYKNPTGTPSTRIGKITELDPIEIVGIVGATSTTVPNLTTDILGLVCVGSRISATINGVEIIAVTDTSYPDAGLLGVAAVAVGQRTVDNFECGIPA